MPIKTVEELVANANSQIATWSPDRALNEALNDRAILVDIRDIRELQREGRVADAVHAPRGMLEFWFDPACQYHREVFAQPDRTYVLFCALGQRSALAAKSLGEMGFENIAHVEGGFAALRQAGARIELPEPRGGG